MKKFHALATHFSQTPSHKNKYNAMLKAHPNIPKIRIKRDLNKTRIEARHLLAKSSLRIKRGIQIYIIDHQPVGFPSECQWKALREMEGVLHAVHPICIFSQYETKFVAGYGPFIKKKAYDSLRSDKLKLIDNDHWEMKPHPDRLEESVETYTAVGQVIWKLCGIVIVIRFLFII